jgi:hypothetical protein
MFDNVFVFRTQKSPVKCCTNYNDKLYDNNVIKAEYLLRQSKKKSHKNW